MVNNDEAIDLVAMALQLGATFVARSFSGDKEQLVPLIKAALTHQGAAFIDCISPCVAFNNHVGSTKSFDYVREHNEAVNRLDVIPARAPIEIDHAPGTLEMVTQHDGSVLALRKLGPTTTCRPARRWPICRSARQRAKSLPGCCLSTRSRRTCTTIWRR